MDEDKPLFAAPDSLSRAVAAIAERSQRVVAEFLDRQRDDKSLAGAVDPLLIGDAFLQMTAQLLASPVQLVEAQMTMWSDYLRMWQSTAQSLIGASPEPAGWRPSDLFDFIRQTYLLAARWIQALQRRSAGMSDEDGRQLDFFTRQFIDAMTAANFFADNGELLRLTADSQGDNLLKGLDHLLAELERAKGELGRRRATPGDGPVVLDNEAMVLRHVPGGALAPVLLVPAWTHSAAALDRPGASLPRWLAARGHPVFLLDWKDKAPERDFAASIALGPQAALRRIRDLTGAAPIHGAGVGLGGTLLAATQALAAARGEEDWLSASYLASLLDFADPGEISVFVAEEQLRRLDDGDGGDGRPLVDLLRGNDLIWSFVVDCFLGERDPFPFDLSRWNADSLAVPAGLRRFHLQKLYRDNLLAQAGGLIVDGVGLDLGRLTLPAYLLAMGQDHLAPWRSVHGGGRRLGGPVRFVRAEGGHLCGLLNPPARHRHGFWTAPALGGDAAGWNGAAQFQPGSWWEDWGAWLAAQERPAA